MFWSIIVKRRLKKKQQWFTWSVTQVRAAGWVNTALHCSHYCIHPGVTRACTAIRVGAAGNTRLQRQGAPLTACLPRLKEPECRPLKKRVIYVNNKGGCERDPRRQAGPAGPSWPSLTRCGRSQNKREDDWWPLLSFSWIRVYLSSPFLLGFLFTQWPVGSGVSSRLFNVSIVRPEITFKFSPAINYVQDWSGWALNISGQWICLDYSSYSA